MTKAPVELAENPQLPGTASTSGAETQSHSDMELTSLGERMVLNVIRENEDEEQGVGGLEECNLEFPIIERQL